MTTRRNETLRRLSPAVWVGVIVLLLAAVGISVGFGIAGTSNNDDVVDAYRDTPDARTAGSEEELRILALELADYVCSFDPNQVGPDLMMNSTSSLESAIAVAEVRCPEVAEALQG